MKKVEIKVSKIEAETFENLGFQKIGLKSLIGILEKETLHRLDTLMKIYDVPKDAISFTVHHKKETATYYVPEKKKEGGK